MINDLLRSLLFEISMALRTVFQIRPKIRFRRIFRRSRILAGLRKTADFGRSRSRNPVQPELLRLCSLEQERL